MKTTPEIPDPILRKAKKLAASKGVTFGALVAQALEAQMAQPGISADDKPWMNVFRGLKRNAAFHAEIKRIHKRIEDEFEKIEPEDRALASPDIKAYNRVYGNNLYSGS
jgi:hypothetical protein